MEENGTCCLCGLPYERLGNNPHPLSLKGRCCDACNEVVIVARLDHDTVMEEVDRVGEAISFAVGSILRMSIAAICAMRGPVLLAEKKRLMATLVTPRVFRGTEL